MEFRENVKVKFGNNIRDIRDTIKLRLSDDTIVSVNQLNEPNRNKLYQEFTICAFIKAIDDPNDRNMHMYTLTYDTRKLRFAIDDNEFKELETDNFRTLELKLIEMGGRILGGYDSVNSEELETKLKSSITGRLEDGWEDEICHDCAPAGEARIHYIEFTIDFRVNDDININNIRYDLKKHFDSKFGTNNLYLGDYYIHHRRESTNSDVSTFRIFFHQDYHHHQSRVHNRNREIERKISQIQTLINSNSNII